MQKVPSFVYEPPKKRLRGVGEVLDRLPMPGDAVAGPMHRMPSLQWKTWVRLAFVEAGSDWRSLNRLRVQEGVLADYGIVPDQPWQAGVLGVTPWNGTVATISGRGGPTNGAYSVADPRDVVAAHHGTMGVVGWEGPSGVVAAASRPSNGRFSVADPRFEGKEYQQYGVRPWGEPSGALSGQSTPGGGTYSVADPRPEYGNNTHKNVFRVVPWGSAAGTVGGGHGPSSGGQAVADPRCVNWNPGAHQNKLRVTQFDEPARPITGSASSSHGLTSGAQCVADPRPSCIQESASRADAAIYGVVAYEETAGPMALPAVDDRLVALIIAEDGTWHRPFTTFELAALQSLFDPEEEFEKTNGVWVRRQQEPWILAGQSDSRWREGIGNAVPSDAGEAAASVFGRTLLLVWSGETFILSNDPIWVRPITMALAVDDRQPAIMAE